MNPKICDKIRSLLISVLNRFDFPHTLFTNLVFYEGSSSENEILITPDNCCDIDPNVQRLNEHYCTVERAVCSRLVPIPTKPFPRSESHRFRYRFPSRHRSTGPFFIPSIVCLFYACSLYRRSIRDGAFAFIVPPFDTLPPAFLPYDTFQGTSTGISETFPKVSLECKRLLGRWDGLESEDDAPDRLK